MTASGENSLTLDNGMPERQRPRGPHGPAKTRLRHPSVLFSTTLPGGPAGCHRWAARACLTEQKMFGGLAFLIRGNMAVSASGQGGLMVRVDPAKSDELVATTPARPVEMRGRSTRGWLRVSTEDLRTKRELAKWVALGTTYARSLPAKR